MQNSKQIFILILVLLLVSNTDTFAQKKIKQRKPDFNNLTRWYSNAEYMGIPLKKIRYRLKNQDTIYVEGVLKNEAILNGNSCHKKITFRNGKVSKCYLSKEHPVGYRVHLYENGRIKECVSAKEQVIQGEKVSKKHLLKFDKNGKLTFAKRFNFFGNYKNQ